MTEPIAQPSKLRQLWDRRPRVIKVMRGEGRPAWMSEEQWAANPIPWYPVWIIAWGGKWRWEICREGARFGR